MRLTMILLAVVGLAACDRSKDADQPKVKAKPALLAFDGADATDPMAIVRHGERLSRVLGCSGCHGKKMEGKEWVNSPEEGVLYSANLTRVIPSYSDAQFSRLLRVGAHPSGRDLWEMPSELFQHLSKPDETSLLAYLRTVKPSGAPTPELVLGPVAKQMIAKGELKPAADLVRETKDVGPVDLGPPYALGRYITRVTCAECHGAKLTGGDNPDLIVAGAYSRPEFQRLIAQGVPNGPRKLKLMAIVAQGRFAHLTPSERDALYAYLKARAERPQ